MARKNFGKKAWFYPQPVFIVGTYDEDGRANAMNAAWGGMSDDTQVSLCLSANHKTVENLQKTGAFTLSMADARNVVECDYVGVETGNKVADKLSCTGWHTTKSPFVNAPLIDELGMALECEVVSYDPETCRLVGEIVNVSVDEQYLDEKGKVDVARLDPITFDPVHNAYLRLGNKVGNAFRDGLKLKK